MCMSLSAGNECIYLWPRKVLFILRTNIFCGDVPQWPPLIGSHYVDHYYATQPTVICLHQSHIMVFNIALRKVISSLQTYKSINENIFHYSFFDFFRCLAWFLFSIDCNICVIVDPSS